MFLTAVVLLVVLLLVGALLAVTVLRRRRATPGVPGASCAPGVAPSPALGSPERVWVERGERVAAGMRELAGPYPALTGAADDADAVIGELRAAAGEVAALAAARAALPLSTLQAQLGRLDTALAGAAGQPAEADLRVARDAVVARLGLAARNRAAVDALLARMRAAVAGMELARDEFAALLAAPTRQQGSTDGMTAATADLADRLAGLRAGLAEVRAITDRAGTPDIGQGQGLPGDLPGSVEGPPRT